MRTLLPALSRIRRVLAGPPPRPAGPPRRRNFADVAAQTIQTERLDRLIAAFDVARPRRVR